MSIKKHFLIAVGIMGLFIAGYILLMALFVNQVTKVAKDIDEHGGLKALVERAWEGKNAENKK